MSGKKKINDYVGLLHKVDENSPEVTRTAERAARLLYSSVEKERAGNAEDAAEGYRRLIDMLPSPVNERELHIRGEALHFLALYEMSKGKIGTALDMLAEAIGILPLVSHYHTHLAQAMYRIGLVDRAEKEAKLGADLAPGSGYAHYNYASILRQNDKIGKAREEWFRALALMPNDIQTLVNIGTTYHYERDLDTAESYYKRARAMDPNQPEPPYNIGVVHHDRAEYEAAIPYYDAALAIKPDHVLSHWNRAITRLAIGDYDGGWRDFEWRWKFRDVMLDVSYPGRRFNRPFWNGETGKVVHLHGEQGFGDVLQFARYAPMVKDLGNAVTLECPEAMLRLFKNSFPGIRVIPYAKDWPGALGINEFDFHSPLMSLPLAFKTTVNTIPGKVPYLKPIDADVAAWKKKLEDMPNGLRVGFCWGSGVRETADPLIKRVGKRKSMSLSVFRPIVETPGIVPVSLQLGPWQKEIKELGVKIHDFMDDVNDFADTAALIANLDIVVTVDTAVAHLAGAMAKPVFLLELYDGCWRWLMNRTDSPWYPTVTLFRQVALDDWPATIPGVVLALSSEVQKLLSE